MAECGLRIEPAVAGRANGFPSPLNKTSLVYMRKKKRPPSLSRSQSAICNPQPAILLGAHMSIGGGVHMAIERACSIECTAMQIFVKNNMQWFARPLTADEITTFLNHQQRNQLQSVFAHANYLINLAARNP